MILACQSYKPTADVLWNYFDNLETKFTINQYFIWKIIMFISLGVMHYI